MEQCCGRATGNDGNEKNGFVRLVELYMVFGSFNIGKRLEKSHLEYRIFRATSPPPPPGSNFKECATNKNNKNALDWK